MYLHNVIPFGEIPYSFDQISGIAWEPPLTTFPTDGTPGPCTHRPVPLPL